MNGPIDGKNESIRTRLAVGQSETSYTESDALRACMTRHSVFCPTIPRHELWLWLLDRHLPYPLS